MLVFVGWKRALLGRIDNSGSGKPPQRVSIRIELEQTLIGITTQRIIVVELVVRVDIGDAIVARKVHTQTHRHDDNDRLEDVQIPSHEHEYCYGVGYRERDGHDGVQAD